MLSGIKFKVKKKKIKIYIYIYLTFNPCHVARLISLIFCQKLALAIISKYAKNKIGIFIGSDVVSI